MWVIGGGTYGDDAVFDNQIWVMAGIGNGGIQHNEIWQLAAQPE